MLSLFGFIGAYLGVFKRREAKIYGLDLLWVFLLTIVVSLVPYVILQTIIGFIAGMIYGRTPDGAFSIVAVLGIVLCAYIARRLVEWREAAQRKRTGAA
jgi:uncharacterized membrane protein YeaQ/YmgE (transglycosylase-associated protein family)